MPDYIYIDLLNINLPIKSLKAFVSRYVFKSVEYAMITVYGSRYLQESQPSETFYMNSFKKMGTTIAYSSSPHDKIKI